MVDLYKKPKNISIGMYYTKDYIGRRRSNNYYYGYSHKYGGYYNYYNKLHNHKKGYYYESQQGETHKEKLKEENGDIVPVSDPPKDANGSDKTESKNRKAEKETEKDDEVAGRDKKKETSRKKCVIKILKRPTEAVSKEEGKRKSLMGGEKGSLEETQKKKKKEKEKTKENGSEDAKECVEQKSKKKKKEREGTSTRKSKKVKDGFKFTSTQELFNLLLKDVKNNSPDEEEEEDDYDEDEMAKQAGEKKGATSAAGLKDTHPGRNDHVAEQNNYGEDKITNKNEQQGKSIIIKGKEGNHSSDVPKMSDKIIEAKDKGTNECRKNSAAQMTKATEGGGVSANGKESIITLKGKKGVTGGSNKYNYQINIGSNISRGRKIKKIIKNFENGKYYYTGSRKDLAAGAANGFGGAGYYLKYATSKYPNFTTSCSFLSHSSKMGLCKHKSLNSRLVNNLSGGAGGGGAMGAGQRNEEGRRSGKKEEEEGFFAVPIYMRSPKPEQIPIPVYLSEVNDQAGVRVAAIEATPETADAKANIKESVNVDGKETADAANVQSRKTKSKGQSQNVKTAPNGNVHNIKDSQNVANFTKKNVEKKKNKNKSFVSKNYMAFNQEQNHSNKHGYDFVNTGNVKNSKVYNVHALHSSYVKAANYNNGCNVHGTGKNLRMEKYFHNKKYYKVKAYLSDNNHRSKNLNPLKEVKIAVY
ncbi:hypothetical protein AK88_01160 [Plasmodium fragile]|uniref:Uncharacterized protein n=1 Tax=Plasmodium fragile TaxID=5857 RepID=A0A0D9QPV4_PLAFR|nr:uncharacterized protein AK88_01160 [Plasmodium fragile]KJP89074.1 hypothetical protein AK88_01160 [Plasmodium fragile]